MWTAVRLDFISAFTSCSGLGIVLGMEAIHGNKRPLIFLFHCFVNTKQGNRSYYWSRDRPDSTSCLVTNSFEVRNSTETLTAIFITCCLEHPCQFSRIRRLDLY
jgi:hypothetical protein